MIDKLINLGYYLILRPHPQMYFSNKKEISKIKLKIKKSRNIEIDNNISPNQSMAKADLLISDLSGIIFDFSFVFEKPVISITGNITKKGKEAELVSKKIWEIEHLEKVAIVINLNDLHNIQKFINLAFKKKIKKNIKILRSEYVFNFGSAGKVAANQILERIKIRSMELFYIILILP